MIGIHNPEALILIPLWLAGWWWLPLAGLGRPLRIAIGLLILLAWLDPNLRRFDKGLDVWTLIDRSSSAANLIEPNLPEIQSLLEQRRGAHDELHIVDFANEIIRRDNLQSAVLPGQRDATPIASALHYTLAQLRPQRSSRLLLITDGFSTEPLDEISARIAASGIPLDLRLMTPQEVSDVRIDDLVTPERTRLGEPFIIEARISGGEDGDVPCLLVRDGVAVGRSVALIRDGRAAVRWTDSISTPGAARYEVSIEPANDAWPGNNRREQWVEATGGQRILLITPYPQDPWAATLAADGIAVEVVNDPSWLRAGHLAGCSLVILNNTPAHHLSPDFLAAIPFHVSGQGGGLIMAGGKNSFAAGGYFDSPVDPLLPISMELKQEHRKLAVAMGIVMDRSGSMMAGAGGGGGGNLTKMDLANAGAARAIELLGPHDAATVFAVDSEAHLIVPLTGLDKNRGRAIDAVLSIRSSGGGIFVYNGLKAGWDELKKSDVGQRHMILFADAADAEEATGYEALVDEMRQGNATLSVIALGNDQDTDAALLRQIAARGGGRILFNADASTLPQLFAQETVAISRSAFLTNPVPLLADAGWLEMAAANLPWPAHVDGYNLNYLRPGAAVGLLSGDEYEAPLLAHWNRGLGRVAAICFPTAGEYSGAIRNWSYGEDFLRTVSRWTLRQEVPPGIAMKVDRTGSSVRLRLLHDETWTETLAASPPVLLVESDGDTEPRRVNWRRMDMDGYEAEIEFSGERVMRGVAQAGKIAIPFGPVSADAGAEWRFDRAMPSALRSLSALSGGIERADLTGIWNAPRRQTDKGFRMPLLIVSLLLFLIEALWSRVDPRGSFPARVTNRYASTHAPAPHPPQPKQSPSTLAPEQLPQSQRRLLFNQARRHKRLR